MSTDDLSNKISDISVKVAIIDANYAHIAKDIDLLKQDVSAINSSLNNIKSCLKNDNNTPVTKMSLYEKVGIIASLAFLVLSLITFSVDYELKKDDIAHVATHQKV